MYFLHSLQGQFTGCQLLIAILKLLLIDSVQMGPNFGHNTERLSVPLKTVLTCGTEKFVTFRKLYGVL